MSQTKVNLPDSLKRSLLHLDSLSDADLQQAISGGYAIARKIEREGNHKVDIPILRKRYGK